MAAIDRENAAAAHYVLANSYFSRESILGAYGLNARVCYLGVDVGFFRPTGGRREHFLLSVGALIANKGYDFLVRALARIAQPIRPPLVIVANSVDGPWRRYIEQLAAQLGVRLEVKTAVSETDLRLYYNQAKLFAYAPYLEPFGLAPLEAMACGTPVVAVKEGGIRESVIDGETGVLTDRDEALYADAITALLGDDEKRVALAERGMEVIRQSWTEELATATLLWHLRRAVHA
jgi:glycosyltransferase involved in cell wall biosynthesis